jgi:hypothetical protein
MAEQYATLAQGSLSVAYTAGNTTLTLQTGEGASFPSSGPFTVAVDSPTAFLLRCTSRSGDVLTVSATGQEGTTAANKSIGVPVAQSITKLVLDNIRAEDRVNAGSGVVPATGTGAGVVALPTSGWTPFNSALLNDFALGVTEVFIPSAGGLSLRGVTRSITVPYTIIALIDCGMNGGGGGTQDAGILVSDGTKYETFDIEYSSGGQLGLRILAYTSVSSTSVVTGPTVNLVGRMIGFKIVNDSTHRTFYYWINGAWVQFYQEASGTFLTETAAGFGGFSGGSTNNDLALRLHYWSLN